MKNIKKLIALKCSILGFVLNVNDFNPDELKNWLRINHKIFITIELDNWAEWYSYNIKIIGVGGGESNIKNIDDLQNRLNNTDLEEQLKSYDDTLNNALLHSLLILEELKANEKK